MNTIQKCYRRSFALLLVLIAILSLTACGSEEKTNTGTNVQIWMLSVRLHFTAVQTVLLQMQWF